MKCVRCNLRNTSSNKDMCNMCYLNILDNKPKNKVDDVEILEYHIHKALWDGCNDCGCNDFYCDAGIKEEKEVKWYILKVRCPNCNSNYEQIMEVRINEFNKNKQGTHEQ